MKPRGANPMRHRDEQMRVPEPPGWHLFHRLDMLDATKINRMQRVPDTGGYGGTSRAPPVFEKMRIKVVRDCKHDETHDRGTIAPPGETCRRRVPLCTKVLSSDRATEKNLREQRAGTGPESPASDSKACCAAAPNGLSLAYTITSTPLIATRTRQQARRQHLPPIATEFSRAHNEVMSLRDDVVANQMTATTLQRRNRRARDANA